MIHYLRFAAVAAAALAAVSCARDDGETVVPDDTYGTLDLASIVVSTKEAEIVTRAVQTDDFILRVYDSAGALVEEWNPYSLRPADYKLKTGMYTLEISSPSLTDAGWENPWYAATEEFEITRDQVTRVGPLVCTLGNIKVTVIYSEGMQEHLTDAEVTVTIGSGRLVFGRNESQAGYFRAAAGESTMTVSLTATLDGVTDTYTSSITGLKAGEWHQLRFTYEEIAGLRTYYIHAGGFVIGQITPGQNWGIIN